ncbi:MAG: O-antigen ligase family protein, partial [Planctomycetota bacterium]|nr:O-antigen ligase family protein [Planctomycetota bacterium]
SGDTFNVEHVPGIWASVAIAVAFLLWGVGHAVAAFCGSSPNAYLIIRQSAMVGYAAVFLYAFLLFGDRETYVLQAALCGVLVSVACAGLDAVGLLTPKPAPGSLYPGESLFGQQTLPIAVLGLGLFLVWSGSWFWRALALVLLLLVGWRQSLGVPQSVVPVGIGGALVLHLVMSGAVSLRGQAETLKRAVLLAVLFGVALFAYRSMRKVTPAQAAELSAWRPKTYQELFEVYDQTNAPANPKDYELSPRPPYQPITNPEVYKLNAVARVGQLAGGTSVVNNVWRLLMWRRMLHDWRTGRPWLGAGVGRAWDFNEVLKETYFHHEEDPSGLNPHNSYLNMLYRYGVVGLAILAALMLSALFYVWKALAVKQGFGDVLLEGILLYFFYTAIFAFFTVTLEGPSYALPLWFSLGLLYARARQILAASPETPS